MDAKPTKLEGALLISVQRIDDERGFFAETFRACEAAEAGIGEQFVQDNHSRSAKGVVRGLHFAVGPGSSKLVRCARGAIWDVIVDLRRESPTFGRWEGFELSDENLDALYIPRGFAHGFCVISDVADVVYKQSAYYDPSVERSIRWNDPRIAIDWPLPDERITVSKRDAEAPTLDEISGELDF
ncbi:MAG: dTDP-4-dehydrorhamnose 3,5-epimerase [Actinobacteria bacterium]|nr:dTDP-4-dehydrorhamnose 3,5-epimerase [Actinomycetota bacterium]